MPRLRLRRVMRELTHLPERSGNVRANPLPREAGFVGHLLLIEPRRDSALESDSMNRRRRSVSPQYTRLNFPLYYDTPE